MIFNRQQIFKTFIALLLLVVFIAPSLNQLIPCCEKEKSSVCLEKQNSFNVPEKKCSQCDFHVNTLDYNNVNEHEIILTANIISKKYSFRKLKTSTHKSTIKQLRAPPAYS
jgi:hypothetical protein